MDFDINKYREGEKAQKAEMSFINGNPSPLNQLIPLMLKGEKYGGGIIYFHFSKTKTFKYLAEHGVDLFQVDNRGSNILHNCSYELYHKPLFYFLAEYFAKAKMLNFKNTNGFTTLSTVIKWGYFDRAELLIRLGADVNQAQDHSMDTDPRYPNAMTNFVQALSCLKPKLIFRFIKLLAQNGYVLTENDKKSLESFRPKSYKRIEKLFDKK